MGLVKTRRLARHSLRSACSRPYGLRTPARGGYAMHPPSPRLRRTRKQQRAKAGMKPPMKGGAGKGVPRQSLTSFFLLFGFLDFGGLRRGGAYAIIRGVARHQRGKYVTESTRK